MNKESTSIAVVTGGGHGIGRALCRRLAADGVKVVVADIEGDAAEVVATEVGGAAKQIDVSDEAAIVRLVDEVEADIGPIDMFISNAGVAFGDGDSGSISKEGGLNPIDDRWDISWNVNVMAQVYAARSVIPKMLQRGGGHIINVASAAGLLSQIGDAAYSTTKHASVGFSESLAINYGDDGIKVSVVCPQAVATRLIGMEDDSGATEGGFGGNELDGIQKAEDVADIIVEQAREGRFMILSHPQVTGYIQRKSENYDRWIGGMRKLRRSLPK
jgi:NAD(P)-dependent dehydrogenase (short-subunit alcohol dehydrogenase family)